MLISIFPYEASGFAVAGEAMTIGVAKVMFNDYQLNPVATPTAPTSLLSIGGTALAASSVALMMVGSTLA